MTYIPEKYQFGIVAHYLEENGFSYTTEASIDYFPVDILAWNDERIIAVELKSKNIEKGILQAQRNTTYVDEAYLALWDDKVTPNLKLRFDNLDIGLLSVGENVVCRSKANYAHPHPRLRKDAVSFTNYEEHKCQKKQKQTVLRTV